jgi:hypothetical protein
MIFAGIMLIALGVTVTVYVLVYLVANMKGRYLEAVIDGCIRAVFWCVDSWRLFVQWLRK